MEAPPNTPGQNPEQDLTQQVARLTQRVYRLESVLRARGISIDEPASQPSAPVQQPAPAATQPATQPTPPALMPAVPPPPPSFLTQQPQAADHSLESRIGSQWFNRIGILAVLIAMAWFLKLAIDNHWIGPSGRVLIGIVAGVALIAWSERFRSRGFAGFSYSLKAVGSGILYLSLWAAYSLFHLMPSSAAFAAMIAVTAFNGFMAWSQESELLALYAIVGGYGTPLLLSNGQNHEVALFSYLLLLNLATLVLIALRPWSRLLIGSFVGTVFFFAAWSMSFYSSAYFGVTAFYLSLFFLLFSAAPHLVRLNRTNADSLSPRDSIALIVLPFANAALGFIGFYGLVDSVGSSSAAPWIAVAFAAFYLLLLRVPNLPHHAVPPLLRSLDLVIAVVFLTIAIPLKTHGRWLTIGWLIEGAALLWLTRKVPQKLLWALSLVALTLGLGALLAINPTASTTILFNERFATYLVGIAVFAFIAFLAYRSHQSGRPDFPIPWQTLAAVSVLIVNALILISISLEIHNYWWMLRYSGNYSLVHDYRMYAQFTYSAFFMLFGAALLLLGFLRNSAFLRWQALVLLAISIGKVFLVDTSELSQGYRVFSFLALGVLLLAVSFAYQRDWLNLRGSERHNQ
ncbi:MAG TPA: DUF2339 domain-containing protein [Acidobacteriaceae bacterium]|nr:DUF2339 domain-containing protein [Acidobacteriaceae bacterium]